MLFLGKLSLIKFSGFDIQNRTGIEAVKNLCPELEEIQFVGVKNNPSPELIEIAVLKSVFATGCWPKVI